MRRHAGKEKDEPKPARTAATTAKQPRVDMGVEGYELVEEVERTLPYAFIIEAYSLIARSNN
jgi:hypothetical protein